MNRIACPFCGPRELEEFSFRSTLPQPGAGAIAQLYERIDRPDSSLEHWQHVKACRAWLVVHRNPSTGEVLEVRFLAGRTP
jgi:heterotetrameric sarcosine oxidase delta subunit